VGFRVAVEDVETGVMETEASVVVEEEETAEDAEETVVAVEDVATRRRRPGSLLPSLDVS